MTRDELLRRANEFEKLGRSLQEHARSLRSLSPTVEQKRLFWPESANDLELVAEALLAARIQRLHYLDESLFGEPAWDMLLILFRAFKSGDRVTVGEVCQSSGTFMLTARRWLGILIDLGLVQIDDDVGNDELSSSQLTELGEMRMTSILVGVQDEFLQRGCLALDTT